MSPLSLLALLGLAALLPRAAMADPQAPATADVQAYAIIVGNNAAGPGQEPLRYAEADAKRVLGVLSELGGYQLKDSQLLLTPTPMELWGSFETIQEQIERDERSGQDSVLFFYYSGHARSRAIDLGPQRVALADLRARIEAMPASLRVVVLDACQSGAISRIKGAAPASDFSTNSIASLSMTGLAIMASSTAAELSQESDSLEGSYFTHHLVSGLRGAADANQDGSVTLGEVYQYAYDTTLLATAVSAVGTQHVTLETDLRGKGDVALTRPAEADAKLRLPKGLGGAFTVSKNKSVIAEISKAKGQSTIVALPPGSYSVLVRESSDKAERCAVTLRRQQVSDLGAAACVRVAIDIGVDKGAAPGGSELLVAHRLPDSPWGIELNLGLRSSSQDAYTSRLETFGYQRSEGFFDVQAHYSIKALKTISPYLQLGGGFGRLESEHYRRDTDGASTYDMRWSTSHLSALARVYKGWSEDRVQLFAEGSLGVSRASSTLHEEAMDRIVDESHYGYAASASLGFVLMPLEHAGLVGSLGYGLAPTLKNELDETHDAAGMLSSIGLRGAF